MPQLIAFAGLPGTGKTTLAKLLAESLGAVLLNKDEVRAALFAPEQIEYSDRQNDFCMAVIYQLAEYHLKNHPERPVIIDGRTYSKRHQIDALVECAQRCQCHLFVIECQCCQETMLARVKQEEGKHLAADRTVAMAERAWSLAEPIELPRLVVKTDAGTSEEHLNAMVQFIKLLTKTGQSVDWPVVQ